MRRLVAGRHSAHVMLSLCLCLVRNISIEALPRPVDTAATVDKSLTITITPSSIARGANVVLDIVTKNISSSTLMEPRRIGGSNFALSINVINEKGQRLTEKVPDQSPCKGRPGCSIQRMNAGSSLAFKLEPGKVHREKIDLSELYDLSQPGVYSIQVAEGEVATAVIKSNVATLSVLAK